MIRSGNELICGCDHIGCKEIRGSSRYVDWKLYEIVFGVDPSVYHTRTGPVVVVEEKFHFCHIHKEFYHDLILKAIADHLRGKGKISMDANLRKGLGCWITFIDILGGLPPKNFQLDYETLAKIYTSLPRFAMSNSNLDTSDFLALKMNFNK